MAEIDRLRQALANARDEERRWAYERSKAERNSAEWDQDQIDRLR
jgi:hypothetical protein